MGQKDRSKTSFGELMSQLGVKKDDLITPKPPKRRKVKRPEAIQPLVDRRSESPEATHRAELSQLLETVSDLRQQRDSLRGALQDRDQEVEGFLQELARARGKLRDMEALRRSDMAQISRLRRELESASDQRNTALKDKNTLQRALDRLAVPEPKAPEVPAILQAPGEDNDSDIRQAAFTVASACQALGVQRLAVVGGSPPYHSRLRTLFGEALDLRLIDGTGRRTLKQARGDVEWADVVIVWGGTLLDHSLSQLYRGEGVLTIAHRGLAGMLRALAEELG
jgi:hypothetical protein